MFDMVVSYVVNEVQHNTSSAENYPTTHKKQPRVFQQHLGRTLQYPQKALKQPQKASQTLGKAYVAKRCCRGSQSLLRAFPCTSYNTCRKLIKSLSPAPLTILVERFVMLLTSQGTEVILQLCRRCKSTATSEESVEQGSMELLSQCRSPNLDSQ